MVIPLRVVQLKLCQIFSIREPAAVVIEPIPGKRLGRPVLSLNVPDNLLFTVQDAQTERLNLRSDLQDRRHHDPVLYPIGIWRKIT
ncbi:hypothetical protein ES703_25087 [subsurface metagenome]